MVRVLLRVLLLLFVAAPAYADPIKYALVNAMFDDGGTATGYVLYEALPAPENPRVTDWAITVIGGTTGIWRFDYDPTNSAVSIDSSPVPGGEPNLMTFVANPTLVSLCNGVPRRIQFDLLQFGALAGETCGVTRQFVSGEFQQQPGPFLTLKAGRQHPASRIVYGGGSVTLKLDISPAGVTTPLDWYFAVVLELSEVRWITAGGISPTPAPLLHAAPVLVSDATVLFSPLNGNTQTKFVIFATDGSSVFAYDHITVIVPPSP